MPAPRWAAPGSSGDAESGAAGTGSTNTGLHQLHGTRGPVQPPVQPPHRQLRLQLPPRRGGLRAALPTGCEEGVPTGSTPTQGLPQSCASSEASAGEQDPSPRPPAPQDPAGARAAAGKRCKRRKRHLRGRGPALSPWQPIGAAGGGGGGKEGHCAITRSPRKAARSSRGAGCSRHSQASSRMTPQPVPLPSRHCCSVGCSPPKPLAGTEPPIPPAWSGDPRRGTSRPPPSPDPHPREMPMGNRGSPRSQHRGSWVCRLLGRSHQTPPGAAPTLTPGLSVVGSSVIFGKELGLGPQCPRERQQPCGAADAGEAGGLHPGGVWGQGDGGSVVREVLGLQLVLESSRRREQRRRAASGRLQGRGKRLLLPTSSPGPAGDGAG